jgi:hypothetical protein
MLYICSLISYRRIVQLTLIPRLAVRYFEGWKKWSKFAELFVNEWENYSEEMNVFGWILLLNEGINYVQSWGGGGFISILAAVHKDMNSRKSRNHILEKWHRQTRIPFIRTRCQMPNIYATVTRKRPATRRRHCSPEPRYPASNVVDHVPGDGMIYKMRNLRRISVVEWTLKRSWGSSWRVSPLRFAFEYLRQRTGSRVCFVMA